MGNNKSSLKKIIQNKQIGTENLKKLFSLYSSNKEKDRIERDGFQKLIEKLFEHFEISTSRMIGFGKKEIGEEIANQFFKEKQQLEYQQFEQAFLKLKTEHPEEHKMELSSTMNVNNFFFKTYFSKKIQKKKG